MVYKPSVPAASDFIAQSQVDFRNNFSTINDLFGKVPQGIFDSGDHVSLTHADIQERGKHKKTTLLQQSSDPSPSANEACLYTKSDGNRNELYYRRNGDAGGNKLTSDKCLSQGGLVLRAFACFGLDGTVFEVQRPAPPDSDEEFIKVPMSMNCTVSVVTEGWADYLLAFPVAMPNDNYIWTVNTFNAPGAVLPVDDYVHQVQPRQNAIYGDTVTTSSIRLNAYTSGGTFTNGVPTSYGKITRMLFQAWTVA